MGDPLPGLDIASPVLAAPMAGGATTPGLVIAAARAGSLGFLAGGYKTPRQLAADIRAVRQHTPAFGVNLFVPRRHPPIEPDAFRAYADALAGDGREGGHGRCFHPYFHVRQITGETLPTAFGNVGAEIARPEPAQFAPVGV